MRNFKLTFHDETIILPFSADTANDSLGRPFITLDFDSGLTYVGRGRHVAALGNGGGSGGGGIEMDLELNGLSVRWRVDLALKDKDQIVGIHWSLENEALVVATAGSFHLLYCLSSASGSNNNIEGCCRSWKKIVKVWMMARILVVLKVSVVSVV